MRRNKSGFTIAEVLIGSGIFFLALMAWVQSTSSISKTARRGLSDFQLAMEQRALSNMIGGMSPSAIKAAWCDMPHPWSFTDPATNACEVTATKVSNATIQNWRELSQAVLGWPNMSKVTQNSLDPELDRAYYTSTIVPLLSRTGCLRCHAGTDYTLPAEFDAERAKDLLSSATLKRDYPDVAQRDFRKAQDIIDPFPYRSVDANGEAITITTGANTDPLARRAILTSRFGARLIVRQFQMNNVLANSQNTQNYVTFQQEKILVGLQPYRRVSRFIEGWRCGDPFKATWNATQGPCQNDETYQGFSCNETCTQWQAPQVCSCGKGCYYVCGSPTCAVYRSNFSCLSMSDDSIETKDDILFASYPTPSPINAAAGKPYPSTVWETIADSYCASPPVSVTGGSPWCGGNTCSASKPDITKCIKPGTCQRVCSEPTWSDGYSCGKNCYRPPKIDGCKSQSFQYTCQEKNRPSTQEQEIMKYSIDSELYDVDLKTYKHVSTQGVVQ